MKLKQSGSQTVGPFFLIQLAKPGENLMVTDHTKGERINLIGTVFDADGEPVPDAMLEIWQADHQGIYPSPNDPRYANVDPHFHGLGRSDTAPHGQYRFETIKPGIVPYDEKTDQAPHVLMRVFMRGLLLHAVTRLYFSDEMEANGVDPVLNSLDAADRAKMIAHKTDIEATPTYRLDIYMQGEKATPFFEP